VQGVKKKDYSLCNLIHLIEESDEFLNEMMGAVVSSIEIVSVDVALLLIHFSMNLPRVENSCFLIDALYKAMENRLLLHSELALQLWVHAKFIVEEAPGKISFQFFAPNH